MKQKLGMKANRAELFSRFGILLIFALVVLVASLVSNRFLSTDNILSVFTQCTVIGVLSCGMTMLIVSGNTDLSAGSGVALAGVVCALVINTSGSWVLAVLATVAVMLLTSALQGSVSLGGQQLSNTSSSAEENATGRTATNGEEVGPFCNNRIRGLGFRRGRTGRCTAG